MFGVFLHFIINQLISLLVQMWDYEDSSSEQLDEGGLVTTKPSKKKQTTKYIVDLIY